MELVFKIADALTQGSPSAEELARTFRLKDKLIKKRGPLSSFIIGGYDEDKLLRSIAATVSAMENSQLMDEDIKNPRKRRKIKRPDLKKSKAAQKAAAKPGAKRNKKQAARKWAKSSRGKAFFKKLGRFNAKRAMTKSERSLRWPVQALQEFLAADPPPELRAEAEAILRQAQTGFVNVDHIIGRVDALAEATHALEYGTLTEVFEGDLITVTTRDVSRGGNAVGHLASDPTITVTIEPRPKVKGVSVVQYRTSGPINVMVDRDTFNTKAEAVDFANSLGLVRLSWLDDEDYY